jgi:putative ABC transport system permease protein
MPADWYALVRNAVPRLPPEVAEEIAQHLADLYDEVLRRGATEQEARDVARGALRDGAALLGNSTTRPPAGSSRWQAGQAEIDSIHRGRTMLVHLQRDVQYALRMFLRQPVFAVITVLTLTLGIGVNVAVFAVMRAALLASMPVPHPERLVSIVEWTAAGGDHTDFSYPLYVDTREAAARLAQVAAYSSWTVGVATADQRERVTAEFTTANYFQVMEVQLHLGPGFTGGDERRGVPAVAIVSDHLWRTMLRSDAGIVGRPIVVDGQAVTITGVAPASFTGFIRGQRADIWIPVSQYSGLRHESQLLDRRTTSWLSLVARLGDGSRREQLEQTLTAALRTPAHGGPGGEWSIHANPATKGDDSLVADLGKPLQLLMIVVGLILVITSANVANLLLARSYSRQGEIAIRESLGASRGRIVQQLMVEAGVLAAAGAAGALLVGTLVARVFEIRTVAGGTALALSIVPDVAVLAFTGVLAATAALATGIIPAVGIRRVNPGEAIKSSAIGSRVTGGGGRLRGALTIVQVALSLVLLVGAGLFVRSLANIRAVDPSLLTDRIIAVALNTTLRGYDEPRGRQFYDRLLEAVRRQPGIQSAALAYVLPVTAGAMRNNLNPRSTIPPIDAPVEYDIVPVSPGFFSTAGVPLVAGRDFGAADVPASTHVIIVNERMKATFWPSTDPIGQPFKGGLDAYTVVGIARDTKYRSLREKPRMVMYVPLAQMHMPAVNLIVKTAVPVDVTVASLRDAARNIDPAMPLYNVRTLAEHVDRSLYFDRLRARLVAWLAALAVALAGVGIYGVVSYTVTQRTREVGIRLALGAQRQRILAMLLASGAKLSIAGLAIGVALSAWVTRAVESQLYGITPHDPLTVIGAAAVLLAVSLAATYIPARRATRIDPMLAVRSD